MWEIEREREYEYVFNDAETCWDHFSSDREVSKCFDHTEYKRSFPWICHEHLIGGGAIPSKSVMGIYGDHHPKQETTNVPNYQEISCPIWIGQPWPTGLCLWRPSAIWAGTTKLMPWSSCWIHVFGGFHVASDVTCRGGCHMVPLIPDCEQGEDVDTGQLTLASWFSYSE